MKNEGIYYSKVETKATNHHVLIQINTYKSSYMRYYSFKELFLYVDSIEMINFLWLI
jgi:hypothetical protein